MSIHTDYKTTIKELNERYYDEADGRGPSQLPPYDICEELPDGLTLMDSWEANASYTYELWVYEDGGYTIAEMREDASGMIDVVSETDYPSFPAAVDALIDFEDQARFEAERGGLFQEYELDAYLGDFEDDYDKEAIIDEATVIDYRTGNRYWREDVDLAEVCQRHDKTAE